MGSAWLRLFMAVVFVFGGGRGKRCRTDKHTHTHTQVDRHHKLFPTNRTGNCRYCCHCLTLVVCCDLGNGNYIDLTTAKRLHLNTERMRMSERRSARDWPGNGCKAAVAVVGKLITSLGSRRSVKQLVRGYNARLLIKNTLKVCAVCC